MACSPRAEGSVIRFVWEREAGKEGEEMGKLADDERMVSPPFSSSADDVGENWFFLHYFSQTERGKRDGGILFFLRPGKEGIPLGIHAFASRLNRVLLSFRLEVGGGAINALFLSGSFRNLPSPM